MRRVVSTVRGSTFLHCSHALSPSLTGRREREDGNERMGEGAGEGGERTFIQGTERGGVGRRRPVEEEEEVEK